LDENLIAAADELLHAEDVANLTQELIATAEKKNRFLATVEGNGGFAHLGIISPCVAKPQAATLTMNTRPGRRRSPNRSRRARRRNRGLLATRPSARNRASGMTRPGRPARRQTRPSGRSRPPSGPIRPAPASDDCRRSRTAPKRSTLRPGLPTSCRD